jgi:hypothetical protein
MAIQHNAVVECVPKHSPGVQMSSSPCLNRAWNNITSKSVSRYRPIHLIVIQQLLADDKKIVIAVRPICATRAASKQDDGARMQSFHETPHRLPESCIFDDSLLHCPYISVFWLKSNVAP